MTAGRERRIHRPAATETVAPEAAKLDGAKVMRNGDSLTLGAFNDDYDTSLHSNRGRFLYTDITLHF